MNFKSVQRCSAIAAGDVAGELFRRCFIAGATIGMESPCIDSSEARFGGVRIIRPLGAPANVIAACAIAAIASGRRTIPRRVLAQIGDRFVSVGDDARMDQVSPDDRARSRNSLLCSGRNTTRPAARCASMKAIASRRSALRRCGQIENRQRMIAGKFTKRAVLRQFNRQIEYRRRRLSQSHHALRSRSACGPNHSRSQISFHAFERFA